jgi:5-methyltetrahydrofolate--homocysteine methyltransferase
LIPFLERLSTAGFLLADGAMGTMLLERGLEPGAPPENMTLHHPEVLADIARAYRDAGADIVETNTFGGSPLKLEREGLGNDVERCNRDAVHIARDAVEDRAYVVGSVGPCGRLLEPYGDTAPSDVYTSFRTQVEFLVDAGVDGLFIETMVDVEEAVLAIAAAKDAGASVPVAAMMTFDPTPRGFYTIMGNSIEVAVQRLEAAGADLVGSNCGNGIEQMVAIARIFRSHASIPVIIQANAGMPESRDGIIVYPEAPASYAAHARALHEAGVGVIGGCCGTTPDHIAALRAMMDADRQ